MKIYINGRSLNGLITGIANFTSELSKEFVKQGNEVTIYSNNPDLKIDGVTVVRTHFQRLGPIYDFFIFGIHARNGDIAFSPANNSALFTTSRMKASTIHDLSVFDRGKDFPFLNRIIIKLSIILAYKYADILFTDSIYSKKRIAKILGNKKEVTVISLGVNSAEIEKHLSSNVHKSKNEKIIITTNATHYKRKNIKSLVEAIKTCKYSSRIKLIVTGVVFDEIEEKFVKQMGYLPTEDFYQLIAGSDFFIYPSFYEGFGLPILEAMICKCPVITSNTSSLQEIMPSKKWLFNPHDINTIKSTIERMIEITPKEKNVLILNNYEYAKTFTWASTAKKYLKIMEREVQN